MDAPLGIKERVELRQAGVNSKASTGAVGAVRGRIGSSARLNTETLLFPGVLLRMFEQGVSAPRTSEREFHFVVFQTIGRSAEERLRVLFVINTRIIGRRHKAVLIRPAQHSRVVKKE